MGAAKELWMIEIEQAGERYAEDGDEAAYRAKLRRLGFDPDEIDNYVEAANS